MLPDRKRTCKDKGIASAVMMFFSVGTRANGEKKGGLAMQCDKSEYRGILAGLEGITGKKAVDSTTMTVKN